MLSRGTKLGTFEITSHIGSGGMGDVYRAHDTKLGRDVAIKVLPEQFARDPERLARFQREAKLLAALNHPNIAAIYGLEQSGNTHYLVMELVEGPTLAERIRSGPVPLDETLPIAKQTADAVEYAHDHSVIHRDLKPANIKVTAEGIVKVLDFGLAKAMSDEPSAEDISNSPTLSMAATRQGVIMGTAAYMSPEQARGKTVDKRTDIWAFGCVLYEMLTGKQAFRGEDVTEILAAVVKSEPDWSRLPESTPASIHTLLRRCLQKEKALRLRDAGDARIEIHEALTVPAAEPAAIGGWRRAAVLGLAALGLVVATGIATWYLRPPPGAQAPAQLVVALPPGDRLQTGNLNVAVSPDGTQLAYVAIRGGVQQLYLRALDNPEAKPISGTEGASNPFFSPDNQWIGFFAQGKLKKVALGGGTPLTVCDSTLSGGASWGPDDTIVFTPSPTSGLWRVSAAGGQPQEITTPDAAKGELERSHRYPQFLPGGEGVVFTAYSGAGWDENKVELFRFDTKERRVLVREGHTGRVLPSGHLIYYRAGALLAVPFDPARLEVTSTAPFTIAEGVLQNLGTLAAAYSLSSDARTLAYIPHPAGSRQFERRLVWVNRQGQIEPLPAPARAYGDISIPPDGQQVAVSITSESVQLWTYDLARGSLTRLTSEQGSSRTPVWTPDGSRIAYRGIRAGGQNLYWRSADGGGSEERLTTSDNNQAPSSWSPDGKVLAYQEASPATGQDIWTLPLEGDRKPRPFLRTPSNESAPMFSPDGHWLAYVSTESGAAQVYVQPYPGPGRKWQVSTDGGDQPQWNPNGRELFYRNGGSAMVVDVTTSPTFSASKPRLLYQGPAGDLSPDGQRFLAIQAVETEQPPTQINIMLNWFEKLNRRVPAGTQ